MTPEITMTIGKLAERAGVNLQTIRYYESLDLLPEPERTESGYRIYDEEYLENINFIKNAQDLGFSLEEISDLVALRFNKKAKGKDVKKLLKDKIEELDQEIGTMLKLKKQLEALDQSCSGRMKTSDCPILANLKQN